MHPFCSRLGGYFYFEKPIPYVDQMSLDHVFDPVYLENAKTFAVQHVDGVKAFSADSWLYLTEQSQIAIKAASQLWEK